MKQRKTPKHKKRKHKPVKGVPPSALLQKRKREREELEQKIKRLQAEYDRDVYALQLKNRRLQAKLNSFEAHERWVQREKETAWADYDRAVDATTQAERELFAASPAYQKYQRQRAAKENRETSNWARLTSGDWRSP